MSIESPVEETPVDREAVAGKVGETMDRLEGLDRDLELKELQESQAEFTDRIARIDQRIKKICPEEGLAEEQTPAPEAQQ